MQLLLDSFAWFLAAGVIGVAGIGGALYCFITGFRRGHDSWKVAALIFAVLTLLLVPTALYQSARAGLQGLADPETRAELPFLADLEQTQR